MEETPKLKKLMEQQELKAPKLEEIQQTEQSRMFSGNVEMTEEMKSRKHAEHMSKISECMKDFSAEFQSEWGKKVEVKDNFVRKGMKWVKRFFGKKEPWFSMDSFAYDNGIVDDYEVEKRSSAATDLMDSLTEWHQLTQNKNGMPEPAESVERLMELAQAANNYCITHEKSLFYTDVGKGRVAVAEKVRKMTSDYVYKLLSDGDRNAILSNEGVDYETGETDKSIEEDLETAAKAYRNYVLQIAKKCKGHMAGEMVRRKVKALRLNERKIKMYRYKHPEEEKRNPLVNYLIHEYEESLAWQKVLEFTSGKEKMEEGFDDMIDEHLVEEGEIESFKKDKINPVNDHEELEPEQLKGIEEIDNWLIRNFQNGGILGTMMPFLKNPNVHFVERVLSMSKRERLHMYYLVENKKRRNSNMLDVGLSQTYVPTLKGFKDQMVATRFKFWKRINGEYTYMHKLSEAFEVTAKYRKEIKAVAEVERDKKMQLENVESKKNSDAPMDVSTERLQKMMLLKGALEEYGRNLQSAKKAGKKKKAATEAICKESAGYCEKLMKEILELDNSVEKEKLYTRQSESTENEVLDVNGKVSLLGKAPGGAMTGLTKVGPMMGAKWNLESAGWANANLWTGSVGEAIGGVTNLLGAVTSLVALCKTGDQLSGTEISEKTLQITQSLVNVTQNAFNIKYLVDTGGAILKTTQQTQVKEAMGTGFAVVGAAVSAGITISKAIGVDKMERHGHTAGNYFKKKREALEKKGKDQLTKQEKRELKYEKNMMKLQEDLKHREETKAAYSAAGTGIAIASIACPMIGLANIAVSLVASIHDGMKVTKLRTKLFDSFFNMDLIAKKATEKRYSRGRLNRGHNLVEDPQEKVKEDLRFRVAAYAGFCDLKTASEYVCTQFARLIRQKLFGENTGEEERNGYISFVKAINLRYNKKKGLPDENILVRKLSAQ